MRKIVIAAFLPFLTTLSFVASAQENINEQLEQSQKEVETLKKENASLKEQVLKRDLQLEKMQKMVAELHKAVAGVRRDPSKAFERMNLEQVNLRAAMMFNGVGDIATQGSTWRGSFSRFEGVKEIQSRQTLTASVAYRDENEIRVLIELQNDKGQNTETWEQEFEKNEHGKYELTEFTHVIQKDRVERVVVSPNIAIRGECNIVGTRMMISIVQDEKPQFILSHFSLERTNPN